MCTPDEAAQCSTQGEPVKLEELNLRHIAQRRWCHRGADSVAVLVHQSGNPLRARRWQRAGEVHVHECQRNGRHTHDLHRERVAERRVCTVELSVLAVSSLVAREEGGVWEQDGGGG